MSGRHHQCISCKRLKTGIVVRPPSSTFALPSTKVESVRSCIACITTEASCKPPILEVSRASSLFRPRATMRGQLSRPLETRGKNRKRQRRASHVPSSPPQLFPHVTPCSKVRLQAQLTAAVADVLKPGMMHVLATVLPGVKKLNETFRSTVGSIRAVCLIHLLTTAFSLKMESPV